MPCVDIMLQIWWTLPTSGYIRHRDPRQENTVNRDSHVPGIGAGFMAGVPGLEAGLPNIGARNYWIVGG